MQQQKEDSRSDYYLNKCRACMKEEGNMMSMYDDRHSSINLPYKLEQLTSVRIDKFDGLPKVLCPKCAYRTNILYNFRLKVQESDRKFRMMHEIQMSTNKKEEVNIKKENSNVQAAEYLELNMSSNDTDPFKSLNIKTDEDDEEESEVHMSQLAENDESSKETSQLSNIFYNIVDNNTDIQLMKTELSEEISEMFKSENVTIMYVPKSAMESMSVENTLTFDQEEIENSNDSFITEEKVKVLVEQEDEEVSKNVYTSNFVQSNATRKSNYVYMLEQQDTTVTNVEQQELCDDMTQNSDKKAKLNKSSSNTESTKIDDSDGSDSDYFDDGKDNILGSVSDAIIRIKEVQQENGIEYQCTLCLQNYNQLTSALLHTVDNHVPSSGPFFCMVCEKDCKSHRELRAHVKIHTGEYPYSCFLCKKAYSKRRYLKRHMICHPSFSRHRCLKCGCRFKSKLELDNHVTIHNCVAPYTCNQCTRIFNHKGNYKRHLISHLDPKGVLIYKYPCNYCGKRFPNNRTLITHIRVHTGEKPFKCDICNKSFSQRGNLLNHTRIHSNPRSYTCEVCGKSFNQRATLRDHSLLHTGEKPHVCNVCGKAFTVSAALRRHMFNHVDGKPFSCENCGMGFVGKYDLRRHMRVHEDRPKEKRRRSPKTNFPQQKSEESHIVLEEPKTETVLIEIEEIEEELLSQNVTQTIPQVESEKENEDALFNLQSYSSALYSTESR